MDKEERNEEILSRREFFKKTAQNVLPFLGVMAFGSLLTSCEPFDYGGGSSSGGSSSGCGKSCSGSCEGDCAGDCDDGCWTACIAACVHYQR